MTQFFDYAPPPRAAFAFSPVVDGAQCTARVPWSVFGRRPRLELYGADGTLLLATPVVGSADPLPLASVAWDEVRSRVVAATVVPHGVAVGTVARFVLAGATPGGFNTTADMSALDATTLVFPQAASPGGPAATVAGALDPAVDLLAGMFATTVVFRESSRRFEVSP